MAQIIFFDYSDNGNIYQNIYNEHYPFLRNHDHEFLKYLDSSVKLQNILDMKSYYYIVSNNRLKRIQVNKIMDEDIENIRMEFINKKIDKYGLKIVECDSRYHIILVCNNGNIYIVSRMITGDKKIVYMKYNLKNIKSVKYIDNCKCFILKENGNVYLVDYNSKVKIMKNIKEIRDGNEYIYFLHEDGKIYVYNYFLNKKFECKITNIPKNIKDFCISFNYLAILTKDGDVYINKEKSEYIIPYGYQNIMTKVNNLPKIRMIKCGAHEIIYISEDSNIYIGNVSINGLQRIEYIEKYGQNNSKFSIHKPYKIQNFKLYTQIPTLFNICIDYFNNSDIKLNKKYINRDIRKYIHKKISYMDRLKLTYHNILINVNRVKKYFEDMRSRLNF